MAASEETFFLDTFARGEASRVDLVRLRFSVFVMDDLREGPGKVAFLGSAGSKGACCFAGDGVDVTSASSFAVGFFRPCDTVGDLVATLTVTVYPAIMAASLI